MILATQDMHYCFSKKVVVWSHLIMYSPVKQFDFWLCVSDLHGDVTKFESIQFDCTVHSTDKNLIMCRKVAQRCDLRILWSL